MARRILELRILQGISVFFLLLTLAGWWQLLGGLAPFNRFLGGLFSDSPIAGILLVYGFLATTALSLLFAMLALRRDHGFRVTSRLLVAATIALWPAGTLLVQAGATYARNHPYYLAARAGPLEIPPEWPRNPLQNNVTQGLLQAWTPAPDYPPPSWLERIVPIVAVGGLALTVYFFSLPLGWALECSKSHPNARRTFAIPRGNLFSKP